jgi:hypothetical protein
LLIPMGNWLYEKFSVEAGHQYDASRWTR